MNECSISSGQGRGHASLDVKSRKLAYEVILRYNNNKDNDMKRNKKKKNIGLNCVGANLRLSKWKRNVRLLVLTSVSWTCRITRWKVRRAAVNVDVSVGR